MKRAAAGTLLALALACGKRGDPLPPLPRNPQPVTGLRLAQRGGSLEVRYVAPRLTTAGARLPVLEVELLFAERPGDLEQVASRQRRTVAPGESLTETLRLPPPGATVRVAARAVSRGASSALTKPLSLTVQPSVPAPDGLVARLERQGVALVWTPPSAPSPSPPPPSVAPLADSPSPASALQSVSPSPSPSPPRWRFHVYRRERVGAYDEPLSEAPLITASFLDETVQRGETWCYAVRTVLQAEPLVESGDSEDACVTSQDVFAPAPPTGITALVGETGVEVSWSPSGEEDLRAYRVYRTDEGGARVRLAELGRGETRFMDTSPRPGSRYAVTAVDQAGNESGPSPPAEPVSP